MALVVLLGYAVTLAPTVTLWDAGEFITAAGVLGIPHPPGTPLFVLLGHVWGDVVPLGDYAWRLNLMSACFSAAGAGFLFLVAHRLLAGERPALRAGGAAAATLIGAFTFTVWQNSNETEVYTVATFSIAAICWLCLRWRDTRGTERAPHALLLIVYLAGLSIGNHLLTLLVGPAVSLFVAYTLRGRPAPDAAERAGEWAEWAVLTALWILLVGVGLGSTPLLVLGGAALAAALVQCVIARSFAFPLLALLVAAVGVSTYAFLYIRSGLDPLLDEADPETWDRLLAVIRREQYPKRSPLDNPIFLAGPENPGRTPLLFAQQIVNYVQYWVWQFGGGPPRGAVALGDRVQSLGVWALFTGLGYLGWREALRRDRGIAYLLGALWLVTGFGLVVYMNFKPGFSLFWDQYPTIDQHEVRERDYFFIASFQVWGAFAGVGLLRVWRYASVWWDRRRRPRWAPAAAAAFALLPLALNFRAASRAHGPDVTIARDFAHNLLQSVGPYGILFTNGDNDTFPVWYLQEVEGVRQDVTVINLSLANLDWYVHQLVTRPVRPFEPEQAPAPYRAAAPPRPPAPGELLGLSAEQAATLRPERVSQDAVFQAGPGNALRLPVRAGQRLMVSDQVLLLAIASGLGRRPLTLGISSGRASWLGLDPHLVMHGLVYIVVAGRADTMRAYVQGLHGPMVDSARTRLLADSVFRFGALLAPPPDTLRLDGAARQVTTSFSIVFLELGNAALLRGEREQALARLRRAYRLNPGEALGEVLRRVEAGAP